MGKLFIEGVCYVMICYIPLSKWSMEDPSLEDQEEAVVEEEEEEEEEGEGDLVKAKVKILEWAFVIFEEVWNKKEWNTATLILTS